MKIAVKECTYEDLPAAEKKWKARGYRITEKTDPKTLEVMEYIRSFSSKGSWVLTRRDPD